MGSLPRSGAYILRLKKKKIQTSGGELFMLQALSWLTIVQHHRRKSSVYFAQALQMEL